jgi:hypothetical protein
VEGAVISLPASSSEVSKNVYELYSHQEDDENCILTSELEKITYSKNRILISKLQPGFYKLCIKHIAKDIPICVYPGVHWNHNANYIVSNNNLVELTSSYSSNLVIQDAVVVNENKEN